jgi:hypothetical protein
MGQEHQETAAFFLATLGNFIKDQPGPVPSESLDWGHLSALVTAHGLGPLFLHAHRGRIPAKEEGAWKAAEMACLVRNLQSLKTAIRIFGAFESAGVAAAGMRGLVLAHGVYPNPALRTMKDLDLLVRPCDIDQVVQAMGSQGFALEKRLRSQLVYQVNGVTIEIHWSFLTPKRYRNKFDADTLLARRLPLMTRDGKIFRLADEDELIGLVTHAFIHHDLCDLHSLVDIGLCMERKEIDWPAVARWCREARLTRMFLFTLALTDRLFNLGRKEILQEFGNSLPTFMQGSFDAYTHPFFARAKLSHLLRQKTLGIYMAEETSVKFRQILRFFSRKDLQDLWKRSQGNSRPSAG